MHRRTITALAIAAALAGVTAQAHAKPSIAVLGLEVITDAKGGLDAEATQVAKELTEALRGRARAAGAQNKYRLAPNSDKDLLEMKLLSGCSSEARRCMAAIGKELKADYLLYGKLEKVKKQGVYRVTLKLLRVERASDIKTLPTARIPFGEASGSSLDQWARRMYNEITGVPNDGTLVVAVENARSGKVFIDGKPVTGLKDGKATVHGVSEGNHDVRIEADGFDRYEAEVTVIAGQKAEMSVALMPEGALEGGGGGGDDTPGRPGGAYRALFYVSAAVIVGGASSLTFSGLKVSGANKTVDDFVDGRKTLETAFVMGLNEADAAKLEASACNITEIDVGNNAAAGDLRKACEDGSKFSTLSVVSGVVMGVGGALAAFSFYKGWVASRSPGDEQARARRRSAADAITITPVVSPHYAGGTVKIEF